MYLDRFPPMGVYETLFKFQDATGIYMGEPGTRPWAQGFPLTSQLPGGPELPDSVSFASADLKYPSATGVDPLRQAIANYYNKFYGAKISEENVAVFAGGRPGIFATLLFLQQDIEVLIEETEYTPYYDKLKLLNRKHRVIDSNPDNNFRPDLQTYKEMAAASADRKLFIKSNPCNPTGVTWSGNELESFVNMVSTDNCGAIIDEAYEFFHEDGPVSAMAHIKNIEETNIFVIGAATKGLQVPGMRTGWVIAAREHIEMFRNFSSIAMGGVSRPSQIYVTNLLEPDRVEHARNSVVKFYNEQRRRYGEALASCGIELVTGNGGFYHWGRLPGNLTADEFNQKLFKHNAAILPGNLCDMHRRGSSGPHDRFIRFSFGPLAPESFEEDIKIVKSVLADS